MAGKNAAVLALVLMAGGAKTLLGRADRHKLRVFLDKSVFEVYANDGLAAVYGNLPAPAGELQAVVSSQGEGARILSAKTWPFRPASFALDQFHL